MKFVFYILRLLRHAIYPTDADWLQKNNSDDRVSTSEVIKITFREKVKIISVSRITSDELSVTHQKPDDQDLLSQ